MADSIYSAFTETATRFPTRPALKYKVAGRYKTITRSKLSQAVDQVVPICHTLAADSVCYILRDAEVTHIVVEDDSLLRTLVAILDNLPTLAAIITLFDNPGFTLNVKKLLSSTQLQETGARALADESRFSQTHPCSPYDTATICYTSGTTGEPKGAMLTRRNILSNVRSAITWCGITRKMSSSPFFFSATCSNAPAATTQCSLPVPASPTPDRYRRLRKTPELCSPL